MNASASRSTQGLPRIGIDLSYLFPGRALGHQRVCEGLVAAWTQLSSAGALGWQPVLLVSKEIRPLFEPSGLPIVDTGISAFSPTQRVLAQNLQLPRVCRRERLDLLYCPGNAAPLFAGLPVVVTLHDLHHRQYQADYAAGKRAFFRVLAEPSLRKAARVVVPSRFTASQAMHHLQLATTVVPMSPQLLAPDRNAIADEPAPPAQPYFVSVSSALPHKNVELLLRAFAAYRANGGTCALLLVGRHPSAQAADGVIVRESIDDAALRRLYVHAMGLLSASEYEGFGLPLAEALALGCPVLAPRMASIPEVLGDDGHYFTALEPSQMALDIGRFEAAARPPEGAGPYGHRTWADVASDYARIFVRAMTR